jgi:hypothetical protein
MGVSVQGCFLEFGRDGGCRSGNFLEFGRDGGICAQLLSKVWEGWGFPCRVAFLSLGGMGVSVQGLRE